MSLKHTQKNGVKIEEMFHGVLPIILVILQ